MTKNQTISVAALEFAAIVNEADISERGEFAEALVQAVEAVYGSYDRESPDSEVDPQLMQQGVAELQFALHSYKSQAAYALRNQREAKKGAL